MPGGAEPQSRRAIGTRRVPQLWPEGRRFRILSIDGGGIRGIFPAAVLAGLEAQHTNGRPISAYFDLVAGTSTGGIIALGLGAGLPARKMLDLYLRRGCEVFPPFPDTRLGHAREFVARVKQFAAYRYDRKALERMLRSVLGERLFGQSCVRLCIPSFDGRHGSVYVFKTPHDPVYQTDRYDQMVTVALATAAAPTYYQPLVHRLCTLVDGGVWANNPIMIALVEALVAFGVNRHNIDILSLGCGDTLPTITEAQRLRGGIWHWRTIFDAASSLQSQAATNQAKLLLGPERVMRFGPQNYKPHIRLDDWRRAASLLPSVAEALVVARGAEIADRFLREEAAPFVPAAPQT